jgi:hypothetical protein
VAINVSSPFTGAAPLIPSEGIPSGHKKSASVKSKPSLDLVIASEAGCGLGRDRAPQQQNRLMGSEGRGVAQKGLDVGHFTRGA